MKQMKKKSKSKNNFIPVNKPKIFGTEKKFINGVPIKNTISKDVNTAKPVLTVKYLKTLRNEYVSINSSIKLYNI